MAPEIQPGTAREVPEGQKEAIQRLEDKFDDLEVELIRVSTKRHAVLFEERKELVKSLPDFWAQVFLNLEMLNIYFDAEDADVFKYLTDFDVERTGEDGDPRPVKLHFSFGTNPYFSNEKLTKEFTLVSGAPALKADFEPSEELETKPVSISWKDDEHNLAAKHPAKGDPEEDEFEPGSFFSCFFASTHAPSTTSIAAIITEQLWPNAIAIYTGEHDEDGPELTFDDGSDEDSDEEDEESDDDANAEIDLEEERPKKKSKN